MRTITILIAVLLLAGCAQEAQSTYGLYMTMPGQPNDLWFELDSLEECRVMIDDSPNHPFECPECEVLYCDKLP